MLALVFPLAVSALAADGPEKTAVAALQVFNPLVGSWKATGTPDGPQTGFWTEKITWGWEFAGGPRLVATFADGKQFSKWELCPRPDGGFTLTATTPDKKDQTFAGKLVTGKQGDRTLTLDRTGQPSGSDPERLVISLLHANRFLYRLESKPPGAGAYSRRYRVGATKEGEPFAAVPAGPECVVSGGRGTITVAHNGTTYYVCCSGCRDAFKEEPEKFIKEYEAKRKK
ncbi:MAG: TRASH domain-containing protein [Gemmataceae bacterium]